MNKHITSLWLASLVLAAGCLCGTPASASGLVGTDYASLTASVIDPRSPLTSQVALSPALGGNMAVLPYLDIAGNVADQRLQATRFDLNNLGLNLAATAYAPVPYVTPYLTLGAGWAIDHVNGWNYHGFTNFAAVGGEANPLGALTVGADFSLADLHKDILGGILPNTRNYEGYAVYWLTSKVGVRASYSVAQPTNATTYALAAILKL
jgi:hypothetical protein